jgi:hypothetical protein
MDLSSHVRCGEWASVQFAFLDHQYVVLNALSLGIFTSPTIIASLGICCNCYALWIAVQITGTYLSWWIYSCDIFFSDHADCEWKAQAGNPCAASFDWNCSGICNPAERMQEVHQRCWEHREAALPQAQSWQPRGCGIGILALLHVNSCKLLAFGRRRHSSCRAVVQALGAAKFWIPMPRIGMNRGKFIGTWPLDTNLNGTTA